MNIKQLEIGNITETFFNSSKVDLAGLVHQSSQLIFPFIFLISIICISLLIRRILILRKALIEKYNLLELTPPAFTEKTAYTTQQLFSIIHNLAERKTILNKLLGKKVLFSFEIVSTFKQGIRYLVRTTPDDAKNLKRNILSYMPHLNVKEIEEYLDNDVCQNIKVVEYKLKRHFAYPLQKQDLLKEHDPVAYITGMMTKLSAEELVSYQIVLSPTQSSEANVIRRKILRNVDVLSHLNKSLLPHIFLILLFPLIRIISLLGWALTTIINDHAGKTSYYSEQVKTRPLSSFEKENVQSIEQKISQQLFETKVRLLVKVNEKKDLSERIRGFSSSLSVFAVPGYQALQGNRNIFYKLFNKLKQYEFKNRIFSLISNSSSDLLSISEISDLYHFPFTRFTQTENIVKIHSRELPAPLSLKREQNFDVVFAKNTYGGSVTDIGLKQDERVRHMYMIGATGTGKTTMILSMASQDIKKGKGVCVIDPHGDLAESLISFIPESRKKDFIYFNPDDIKHPIGLNLLELTPGLDEDDQLREKELITEGVISLFRKIFSEVWSAHAHRLEYTLRNTIQTALTLDNPTLFTVYNLLTNPDFQKNSTKDLEDENLKNFWKYEFGKAGDYQKVKMIGPVTSRIGRFLFSPSAKRIIEQTKSTINFDNILDDGKILVCNLSKGKLGEDTSEVLGIMILTKIQLASLKRARIAQSNRKPFYLYVDEFQNFATPSFIQMLSEARKYGLNLVMAEQSTSQQKDRNLVNVVLANVGTTISFRSANPEDEKLMLPQFSPYVEKGEIANLPSFRFYAKISAINPEEPFSGETTPAEIKFDKRTIEGLLESSQKRYAIVYQKPKSNTKPKTEAPISRGKDDSAGHIRVLT